MKWKKTFVNKDGSFETFDWSLSDDINHKLFTTSLKCGLIMLLSAIASTYCLMWYAVSIPKHRFQQAIAGIIGSLIWVLDYMYGFFTWYALHQFKETYVMITAINLIILVLHVITLIFDKLIFPAFDYKDGWLVSLGFFALVIYKLLPTATRFVENMLTMAETAFLA